MSKTKVEDNLRSRIWLSISNTLKGAETMGTTSNSQALATQTKQEDVQANIDSEIEQVKILRFSFEKEDNLLALGQLETALLSELDLLDTTRLGVSQRRKQQFMSQEVVSDGHDRSLFYRFST